MLSQEQFRRAMRLAFGRRTAEYYADKMGMKRAAFNHAYYGHFIPTRAELRIRSILGERMLLGDEATRPMLIGINDYHSSSALKPYWPTGCGLGHTMWYMMYEKMLMSKIEYIMGFDRHTLIFVPPHHSATKKEALWRALAYAKGQELRPRLSNRTAILMDEGLMRMLSLPHNEQYLRWHVEPDGFKWCRAPRRPPLGSWKEPDTNARVAERLVEIYTDWFSMPV